MALRVRVAMAEVGDHGGSLARARALFAGAPEPFVDLSTGINPNSYPLSDLPATAFSRLPEPAAELALRQAAAEAYGAPSAMQVVAAPGTQILLPRVAALVEPGRAVVLGPTYAEHARAAALCGHRVEETSDVALLSGADLAIVVNPNNPDGRIVSRQTLLSLADRMAERGGLLVVDEAFMDAIVADQSLAADADHPGLVVLRSFGKFYGLAGLRLGFALCRPNLATALVSEFGPWAVSGPTLATGLAALADATWQTDMRARLAESAARLDGLFADAGLQVAGGTPLFRFLVSPRAPELFSFLGNRGLLVRRFGWRGDVLRIGLPGAEREWQRLAAALDEWRAGNQPERSANRS